MNIRKGILLTALTLATVSIVGAFSNVQASVDGKTLNIKELRDSGYAYKAGTTQGEKVIWKIFNEANDQNETFYCIKAGPGFGSSDMTPQPTGVSYTKNYNMRKKSEIPETYLNAINTNNYEELMWVLDQCYIQPKKDASTEERNMAVKKKENLLGAVENYIKGKESVYSKDGVRDPNKKLTEYLIGEDIEAIQQLAIWHYTNEGDSYSLQASTLNIFINKQHNDISNYVSLRDGADEDIARLHAMWALFDYLILTPKQDGFSYDYANANAEIDPVSFAETTNTPRIEVKGETSIVGPYKINQVSNVNYSLEANIVDGNNTQIEGAVLLDSNKQTLAEGTTIKNLVGSEIYISIPTPSNVKTEDFTVKLKLSGKTLGTKITYWSVEGAPANQQPIVQLEYTGKDYSIEQPIKYKKFDLSIRKFITSVRGQELTGDNSRVPTISNEALKDLADGKTLTVQKVSKKAPVSVEKGNKVVYTIRVYNEGEVDGWATKITDYLPEGLKFIPVSQSSINRTYGWTNPSNDGKTIVTEYLASEENKLKAFNKETLELGFKDIQIECEVTANIDSTDKTLKNIAEITANKDIYGSTDSKLDSDSVPDNVETDPTKYSPKDPANGLGEEDDDDYEDIVILGKYFDLSLRKFVVNVTDSKNNSHDITNRIPNVNVTTLANGTSKNAIYNHKKEPVGVSNGNIVTYTIRVYNEGQIDGYVAKITDYLPEQLEFIVDDEINAKYGWTVSSKDGRVVSTDITSPKTTHTASQSSIYSTRRQDSNEDKILLKAFNKTELDYIDVLIRCKVKEDVKPYEKITNLAEISGFTDSEGNNVKDRDSIANNLVPPSDKNLPNYKDTEIARGDQYIPGEEDDDNFEKLILQRFDLSLQKFITGVVNGEATTEITNRVPIFTKGENGDYKYETSEAPVEVANGNIIIYTLRIFNEGNVAGYAAEVKDNLPSGLEFLPDNSINVAFGWKMYKEDNTETTQISEASYIKTDFLSKNKESNTGDSLINGFDPSTMTMPDYKDIKVAFKVVEPNTSDRIIINTAEIAQDTDKDGNPVDDTDSVPNNNKEDEDDLDTEKIKVKYFDLSLKKWVTESIVTYNGKTTVTKSGHTGDENPEAPMKVEVRNDRIKDTTVKFRFSIKVTNEGEIEGYATEIVDYIPENFKFDVNDNPNWKEVDGRVTTDALKDTLLQPGESATVEIVLTWINSKNNMGEKVNWAEISKDNNPYNSPDIDSTPDNNVKEEDDIDSAPVLLTPATGKAQTYIVLSLSCVVVMASGIFLIKKFVI